MSKKLKIFMLLISLGLFIISCSKKPKNPFTIEGESLSAYHTEIAKVDYEGENNVAFFDFSSGTITHIKHDVWDIAFATYDSTLMIANSGDYGFRVTVTNTKSTNWLKDYSGEENNGTFYGENFNDGTINGANWVSGKKGDYALSFDGNSLTTSNFLNLSNDFTYSFWYKKLKPIPQYPTEGDIYQSALIYNGTRM